MEFEVELQNLGEKGKVVAKLDTVSLISSIYEEKVPCIVYEVQYSNEKLILYRLLKREKEWFPMGLNSHISDFVIKGTMIEIEKYEADHQPKY